MNRTPLARRCAAGLVLAALPAATAAGHVYDTQSTELLQEYASAVLIDDIDDDGSITDMDFSVWVIEQVFSEPVADYDQNGDADLDDAVIALASELTALAADFDNSAVVDEADVLRVVDHLGGVSSSAVQGDLNADNVVDEQDLLTAAGKVGTDPAFDPVDVAINLLLPLLDFDPAELTIDEGLIGDPPGGPIQNCGSATCKAICRDSVTGQKWTYRLFMVGFCGSQIEAQRCCSSVTSYACTCSEDGFEFDCWLLAQGSYVTCLLAIPD